MGRRERERASVRSIRKKERVSALVVCHSAAPSSILQHNYAPSFSASLFFPPLPRSFPPFSSSNFHIFSVSFTLSAFFQTEWKASDNSFCFSVPLFSPCRCVRISLCQSFFSAFSPLLSLLHPSPTLVSTFLSFHFVASASFSVSFKFPRAIDFPISRCFCIVPVSVCDISSMTHSIALFAFLNFILKVVSGKLHFIPLINFSIYNSRPVPLISTIHA